MREREKWEYGGNKCNLRTFSREYDFVPVTANIHFRCRTRWPAGPHARYPALELPPFCTCVQIHDGRTTRFVLANIQLPSLSRTSARAHTYTHTRTLSLSFSLSLPLRIPVNQTDSPTDRLIFFFHGIIMLIHLTSNILQITRY